MARINMADPHFSAADREWIHREIDAILDGALSMGPNVQKFEQEFAALVGVRHCIALSTCTAALEVALTSRAVAGGEVIVPPQTFVATGMAVHFAGATPVFAEISPATMCLDLNDVIRRITPRTKAVILVHMAGLITPEVLEFRDLCDSRDICLIEDAAHAPGARHESRVAGSIGHIGCFSFYPTKVITSGEGGMLSTNDDAIAAYARSMQHRGRDMRASGEYYVLPGRNLRMTEMAALLGRVQLSHLGEYLQSRRRIAAIYREELVDCPGARLILPREPEASSFWKVPVVLEEGLDRENVTRKMSDAGIAVDWAYQPALHLQPVCRDLFKTHAGQLPLAENLLARHICLPCHARMTDADATRVARTLKDILGSLQSRP